MIVQQQPGQRPTSRGRGAFALILSFGMATLLPAAAFAASAAVAHQDETAPAHAAAGASCTTRIVNQPLPQSNPKDVFRRSTPVREKICRKS